jgi:3'(2'), 5'-bisphosphate nucleotidase
MKQKNIKINLDEIIDIAQDAGKEILKIYYKNKKINSKLKADLTPVTEADEVANKLIIKRLKKLYPNIPIISEESKIENYEIRKNWNYVWLIDPLDGTKDFISRSGEFSVNIALIKNNKSILGVINAPTLNKTYYAQKDGGSYLIKNEKRIKLPIVTNKKNYVTFISKNDGITKIKEWLQNLNLDKKLIVKRLGSSLKGCFIAEGKADFYLKMSSIMEWDTAAMQVILEEAGKQIVDFKTKKPLKYNKRNLRNPFYLIN